MCTRFLCCLLAVVLTIMTVAFVSGEEGMWMLDELRYLPLDKMKARGLELTAQEIYELKEAIVLIGGGSGAFVSPEGLILTNHHVAFGAIQHESTLEENFIQNGFLARTMEEELHAPEYDVYVTLDFEEVTDDILEAVNDDMSYFERYQAIEEASKELVAECEKDGKVRCEVVNVLSGTKYYLYTYERIKDVRLVYAPPNSIGGFGGDIDNWMWPRHTGDFSFMRAYVAPDGSFAEYSKENVPYKPRVYLPISTRGYDEGSYAMILGYPGYSYRYRSSYSIDLRQNVNYPSYIEMSLAQLDVLRTASQNDPELAIKFADRINSSENFLKNSEGMLEGLKKTKLLQRKLDQEAAFTQFLSEHPDMEEKFGDVLPGIEKVYDELYTYNKKQDMLQNFFYYSDLVGLTYTIVKWGIEKTKDDMDRERQYQERNIPSLRENMETAQRDLHVPTDQLMLEMLINKATELPAEQKIEAVERIVHGRTGDEKERAIKSFVAQLFGNTSVHVMNERLKMFDMTIDELKERNDSLIDFVADLEEENKVLDDKFKAFVGAVYELRPRLIRGMYEWKKSGLYADANRTLRFTYGTIKGYSPRDAVRYNYVTTLNGVIEKDTGEEPFDVPERLKQLVADQDFGRYADPKLKDIPVDFLTTHDSTGGSSGSPVINGRGEIIGVAFDGNYESMTSDYQYDYELTRAINVDARYVLFVTDKFGGAQNVLEELDIQ
ncbi:MAG: S46 family peptidase [Gemmatimonadota bacterium]|nr:MAG: S46 family peptidase [Gemmatimonadota bacterium]